MPTKKTRRPRRDILQEVTDQIVAALEEGVMPWRRPWRAYAAPLALPHNPLSETTYRGLNVLVLWGAGFSDPRFGTFKQVKAAGGSVRKGSKGVGLVKWVAKEDTRPEVVEANGGEPKKVLFPSCFTVFNLVEQCDWEDGVVPGDAPAAPAAPAERESLVEPVAERVGARVVHGGSRAFFRPADDFIGMPVRSAFESVEAYDATLAHELVHWTGHASRLDRTFGKRFGDEAYAMEELVAEMGSAFVAALLGLDMAELQHASYVDAWLKVLKSDKRAVVSAASAAQKAVDLLLPAVEIEVEEDEDERVAA